MEWESPGVHDHIGRPLHRTVTARAGPRRSCTRLNRRMFDRASRRTCNTGSWHTPPASVSDHGASRDEEDRADPAGVTLHLFCGPDSERLRHRVPGWKEASVWVCGPTDFGHSLRADLVAHGLPQEAFHEDMFEMC